MTGSSSSRETKTYRYGWDLEDEEADELVDECVEDGQRATIAETATSVTSVDASWGEPIPLGPPAPDPLPTAVVPDSIRAQVESVSRYTQVPTDLSLQVALAAISTAVAGRAVVQVRPGWTEPLNIWNCTVLEPANRKSAVVTCLTAPIYDYEAAQVREVAPRRQQALDELRALEKALEQAIRDLSKAHTTKDEGIAREAMRAIRERIERLDVPASPRLLASDVTPERLAGLMAENDGRIGILAPEGDLFRIMAGRYTGGRVHFDVFKRAWTGEPIRDDRVGREGTYLRRPALTLGLTVQPAVFQELENRRAFRGEGVLGRFLYAVPPSKLGYRKTGLDVPALDLRAEREYARVLRALLDAEPAGRDADGLAEPHRIELSDGARAALHSLEADVERMLRPGGTLAAVLDWAGKLVGNVVRVAGAIHAAGRAGEGLDPFAGLVSSWAMEGAVLLGRAWIGHALVAFDVMEVPPEIELARYVLRRAVQADDPERLTKRDLHRLCQGNAKIQTAAKLDEVLRTLEKLGWVREQSRESTGGRPPSPWVKLNPKALEDRDKGDRSQLDDPFGDVNSSESCSSGPGRSPGEL